MTRAKFMTISLSPEKDADILDFFAADKCRDRSYCVRKILRAYIEAQQAQATDDTKGGEKDEA